MMMCLEVIVIVLFGSITHVFSQVCVQTKMTWRDVPETYMYTYLEAYEKPNCLFWCTDTRVATAVGTRIVRKQVAEQINVCCDGYVKDESYTGNSFHCMPLCSPSCINGYCKSPGLCNCNTGYLPDMLEPHRCNPLCIGGCDHGNCTAPNICECNPGYTSKEGVCKPICSEPCQNGVCVAPETCDCLPGYKKSDYDICEQYCTSYTASGECVTTITCEPGWVKVVKGSLEICQPVCSEPCINATCVAPETCHCFNGYIRSFYDTCEPYCSSGCPHGSCISPETCVCEPGWFKKESNGACLPHCDHSCGNGTCIAPNICECFPSYVFDDGKMESPLCVPVCDNCKEACFDVENCTCEWPLVPKRMNGDGTPCDCLDNCSEEHKCEKIICVSNKPTAPDGEVIIDDAAEEAIGKISTTAQTVEDDVVAQSNTNQFKIEKASWFNSKWFYGIGSVVLVSMAIVMTVAIFKRKCFNSFGPNGDKELSPSAVVHYKQTSMT